MIVALEFKPFKKIGFGIGYNSVSIFAEDSEDNDEFEYEYDGYFLRDLYFLTSLQGPALRASTLPVIALRR